MTGSKSILTLTPAQDEFWKLARIRAISKDWGQPYIARAILHLIPVNAPDLGTAGVDKYWRCYIDFDYFMNKFGPSSDPEAFTKNLTYFSGVLNHEPWHLLNQHLRRMMDNLHISRDPDLWNIANDLAINGPIEKLIPSDGCIPGKGNYADFPAGLTSEEYMKLIIAKIKKKQEEKAAAAQENGESSENPESGQQGQSGKEGKENDSSKTDQTSSGAPGEKGADGTSGKASTHLGGADEITDDVPNCGSGAGGRKFEDYELAPDEAEKVDDKKAESLLRGVAQDIQREPGNLPGSVKDWAEAVLAHESPDWRTLLRASARQAHSHTRGNRDYDRARVNRRHMDSVFIRPGMKSPLFSIMLAVDTSASQKNNLGVVVDETKNIARMLGVKGKMFRAFAVDSDVDYNSLKEVYNPSLILEGMRKDGGTRMRPAFEYIASLKGDKRPNLAVLLTDGKLSPDDLPTHVLAGGAGIRYVIGVIRGPKDQGDFLKIQERVSSWATVIDIPTE